MNIFVRLIIFLLFLVLMPSYINAQKGEIHGIVKDELAVIVSTPVNNPIVIDIIDINGRLVLSNKYQYANGTFVMPVDNLNKGMYFVRISNAQGALTKQFFKN